MCQTPPVADVPRPGEMHLLARVADKIRSDGPLPFDAFMQVALYDPDAGYFTAGALRSHTGGDFLTSPEVSPLFGATIAAFVDAEAARIGRVPIIAEVGAGSGSLLRPLVAALKAKESVWAVEVARSARERISETVPEAVVVEDMDALPVPFGGVILANELLDNLPAAIAVRRGNDWAERFIAADGDLLVPVEDGARPDVAAWADRHAGDVPEGGLVEVQIAATTWVMSAVEAISAGALVAFDYGDTAEGLLPRRDQGTLRTYRAHHLGPDPLLEPGATDITMDVNFTAMAWAATAAGADTEVITQAEFLTLWGMRDRLSSVRHQELDAARRGDAIERLRLRSTRTEAETLLHPRGLGDFRVLIARR